MKKSINQILAAGLLLLFTAQQSCKKEVSCATCTGGNQRPVANAGEDRVITLPLNSVTLNGSGSSDPDNNISGYSWSRVSGPSSFTFSSPASANTQVAGLVQGEYLFELKVTDAGGLTGRDTVRVTVNPDPGTSLVDVYVAGTAVQGTNSQAVYWKNGQLHYLNGGLGYSGTKIAIAGNTIAVAATFFEFGYQAGAYWINGNRMSLGSGSTAYDVAISGNDVYVAGSQWLSNGSTVAKYWKNGQEVVLPSATNGSEATSIVVVGTDVYVAGMDGTVAKYWKNGQPISLTDGSRQAQAWAIAVVGNDVYVAGSESNGTRDVAKYWKNGQEIILSDGTKPGYAVDITIVGADVYVAGWEGDFYGMAGGTGPVAKYWKNGQSVVLAGGNTYAYASSMAVHGSDVFVAGQQYTGTGSVPLYWKNGQPVPLTSDPGYNGASSIVVVNR